MMMQLFTTHRRRHDKSAVGASLASTCCCFVFLMMMTALLSSLSAEAEATARRSRSRRLLTLESSNVSCEPMESAQDAYKYRDIVLEYLRNVDDIAVEADDPTEWYNEYIQPLESGGIAWNIDAGPRIEVIKGTDAVRGLWESFGDREFAYHTWSNFVECTKPNGDAVVALRYHGVTREGGSGDHSGNEDIFGHVEITIKTDEGDDREDLITEVYAKRSETLPHGCDCR